MNLYLPVFIQKDQTKKAIEVFKGIALRFKNANHTESSKVFPFLVQIPDATQMEEEIKKFQDMDCFMGIAIMDSDFICKVNANILKKFILIAALASGDIAKQNIFQLILSEWEAKAIRKILENCGTEKDEWKILTDTDEKSKYIRPFLNCLGCEINYVKSKKFNGKSLPLNKEVYIVIGEDKWKIIKFIRAALKKKSSEDKIIITTSSFEDWRKPSVKRKIYTEGVMYTYPKLSDNAKKVIENFLIKFGYKPSICHLLAYDSASIALETLLKAGLHFESIRRYLTSNYFETIVISKRGFNDKNGKPFLFGSVMAGIDLWEIKYVDKNGEYRSNEQRGVI